MTLNNALLRWWDLLPRGLCFLDRSLLLPDRLVVHESLRCLVERQLRFQDLVQREVLILAEPPTHANLHHIPDNAFLLLIVREKFARGLNVLVVFGMLVELSHLNGNGFLHLVGGHLAGENLSQLKRMESREEHMCKSERKSAGQAFLRSFNV